jgi:hypothetical protein
MAIGSEVEGWTSLGGGWFPAVLRIRRCQPPSACASFFGATAR